MQTLSRSDRCISEAFTDHSGLVIPSMRPAPFAGTWADELPLNSREISEALYEAQRSIQLLEDEDQEGNVDFDEETAAAGNDVHVSKMDHVARCYKHDPYNFQEPYNVMYCCHCDACVHALSSTAKAGSTVSTLNCALTESDANTTGGNFELSLSTQHFAMTHTNPNWGDSTGYTATDEELMLYQQQQQYEHEQQQLGAAHGYEMMEQEVADDAHWDHVPTTDYSHDTRHQQQQAQQPWTGRYHYHQEHYEEASRDSRFLATPRSAQNTASSPSSANSRISNQQQEHSARPAFQTHAGLAGAAGHQPNSARVALAIRDAMAPQTVSGFMPPPPPPFVLAEVLEQEGCPNPQGVHYHIIKRWYTRVLESQRYFVSGTDVCPPPDQTKYSFDTWCEMAMGWWYKHFEHMQKKKVARFHFGRRY